MPTSSLVSRASKKTRLRHALLAITLTLASATFPALASTKLRLDIPAQDLGSAVTLGVLIQKGRPVGSSGEVELRFGTVNVWEDGKIARITNYTDIDEARAAAEHLAEERADG